jgi:DNA-directed RNA polymerase subunit E'/Rpb7
MDNIFIESLFRTPFRCDSKSLTHDIDTFILEALKNLFEGLCNKHGYVVPDSLSIVKRSIPYIYGSQLDSGIKYDIVYKATICCPATDNVIKCTIDKINKLGILCITHPMNMIIAKDFHKNTDSFNKLSVGDEIEIKIIDKRFNLNDKIIQVIAKLNNEDDAEMSDGNQSQESDTSDIEDDIQNGQNIDFSDENKEATDTDDTQSELSSSSDEDVGNIDSDKSDNSSDEESDED